MRHMQLIPLNRFRMRSRIDNILLLNWICKRLLRHRQQGRQSRGLNSSKCHKCNPNGELGLVVQNLLLLCSNNSIFCRKLLLIKLQAIFLGETTGRTRGKMNNFFAVAFLWFERLLEKKLKEKNRYEYFLTCMSSTFRPIFSRSFKCLTRLGVWYPSSTWCTCPGKHFSKTFCRSRAVEEGWIFRMSTTKFSGLVVRLLERIRRWVIARYNRYKRAKLFFLV